MFTHSGVESSYEPESRIMGISVSRIQIFSGQIGFADVFPELPPNR